MASGDGHRLAVRVDDQRGHAASETDAAAGKRPSVTGAPPVAPLAPNVLWTCIFRLKVNTGRV